jgi:phosphoribosylanthranilate isomerase
VRVSVKICGCNSREAIGAAVASGADYVGLVFYPPSPRSLTAEAAAPLAASVPERVLRVGLFVDPDDETLRRVMARMKLDLVQLHGAETPDRVAAIKRLTGLPAMKAIKVATAADVATVQPYIGVADRLLFDAKAPASLEGALPGGNAVSFDWALLAGRSWPVPWMLSGGLHSGNIAEAVKTSGARTVDVSSGVETRPGMKNPEKIRAFLSLASSL